jgi:hypothetical protein
MATTTGIVLTESRHPGGLMVSEAPGRYSRQAVTIAVAVIAGQILGAGTSGMGSFAAAAAVAAKPGGNTGNGMVSAPTVGANVQAGTYRLVALSAAAWQVEDPQGRVIGEAVNGTAFAGQIGFTIAAGGTAFAAGDAFSIAVAETDPSDVGQFEPLNLSATDGTQNAAGISWGNYTPPAGGTIAGLAIVREAEVRGVDLTYPPGATAQQIAAINAQLLAIGIVVR